MGINRKLKANYAPTGSQKLNLRVIGGIPSEKKELNKKYSYKQVFRMLSKYKKVRTDKDGQWEDVTKLKYIEELIKALDV